MEETRESTVDIKVDNKKSLPFGIERLRSGMLVITQAYCPDGHNLVNQAHAARFAGYPGIVLQVEGKELQGELIVSPIHGDDTKFGETDFEPGEVLIIKCPTCGVELPKINLCGCIEDSYLVGMFLDDDRTEGNQVAVCQAWGCLRSRVMDRFQILSKAE